MKLAGDYTFEAPQTEVWKALLDPVVLAAIMPGCEKLELVDGTYEGELNIKIGPVQGKFKGKVTLSDIVEPESYTINVDGRGAPGFVKAVSTVKLDPIDTGTQMVYDADAKVGGKIASVGQRLLDASAKAIIKQSLEGLHETIKLRTAASQAADGNDTSTEAEPPPPPKQVTQTELASAVAKEVAKSLVPPPVLYGGIAVAVAVLIWVVVRVAG